MAQAQAEAEAEAGLSQAGGQALLCAMQIVAISAEAQLNCNEADKLPPPPEPRPPPTHTPAHTHALPRFGLQIARAEQINCYKILPKSRIQKANSVQCMCALGRVCVRVGVRGGCACARPAAQFQYLFGPRRGLLRLLPECLPACLDCRHVKQFNSIWFLTRLFACARPRLFILFIFNSLKTLSD